MSYDLWSHPGHCTDKRHLCALVSDETTHAKVRDLDAIIVAHQYTADERGKSAWEVLVFVSGKR